MNDPDYNSGREWAGEYIDDILPTGEVTAEPAMVYRAAGRRWLTLDGAINAQAREAVSKAIRESGENMDPAWFQGAKWVVRAAIKQRMKAQP